ncbi:MAG TPA: MerR family transcriptional regulator [Actinomycetes bacterium]
MDRTHAPWTLAELTDRVAEALAVGYRGQPSGRVREVPDQRAIRWYTTLGLVDRPAAMRGRTALYGRRHLLQLVAIKRLQAEGRSLAEVQVELAAAGDERLERIARLPATPRAAAAALARRSPPAGAAAMVEQEPAPAADRPRFWAAGPAAPEAGAGATPPAPPDRPEVTQIQAVQLGDGVTLLLGAARPLGDDDLDALRAAATPLLAALRTRGRDDPKASPRRELP